VVSLLNAQTELQKETGRLVKAMRVPHVRGRWGEITLRRAAELSGMVKHCDFFEQPTTVSDNGLSRPDMMVLLPGDRKVIIDAKVPILAYLDALEAETDEKRDKLLMDHAGHVQNHMRQLAQKSYWYQFEPTPEFVVMFIPGENFFSAALAQNPDLIEFGVQRGVIPATPTTLITLLKTISFAWRQEMAAENTKIISALGKELYERLNTLAKHVNRLGRDIDRCAQTYNQVLGSFEKRVFSAARKFSDLGVTLKEDKELLMIEPVETKAREVLQVDMDPTPSEKE
jgi:DNA recombination protein RmuC